MKNPVDPAARKLDKEKILVQFSDSLAVRSTGILDTSINDRFPFTPAEFVLLVASHC